MENKTIVINNTEVEYWFGYSSQYNNEKVVMSKSSIDHLSDLLNKDYSEGELCEQIIVNNEELEVWGWWKRKARETKNVDSLMKYENVIGELEKIKANELDNNTDYEAIEAINNLIEKLESLEAE